jgi:CDGSH-type Zn-finger protein
VTVHVKPAGPLAVVGPARVVDADGEELAAGDRLFLCRCGHSNNKPLCDGSHKMVASDG